MALAARDFDLGLNTSIYASLATNGSGRGLSQFTDGWINAPNIRGTASLVMSSIITVFLCTWTVTCLNVPAKDESWWQVQIRRARWMVVGIFGPEFVLTIASGQWASALRSRRAFRDLGHWSWTTRHGFFADMGGIQLSAPDMPPFPINAKHLHYLITHGYLSYPEISTADISDKSKANVIAKTITILQSSWLLLQSLARWAQNLGLSTLELSSVAIVICTLATYVCWLHKPLDVETAIVLETPYRISDILLKAGDAAAHPYRQTPLDFIDNLGPSWSANVMTTAKIPSLDSGRALGSGPVGRPLPRFTNDRLPDLAGWTKASLFSVTLLYAGIHVAAWNFPFPTHAERILWQVCSSILLVSTFMYWFVETAASWTRRRVWLQIYTQMMYGKARRREVEVEIAAGRPKVQAADLPLWWEFWLLFLLWCIYVSARTYLIVEAFVGLRHVPVTIYWDVEWTAFIPHW